MKDNLSFLFASEIRFCALLIGLIEIAWSFIGMQSDDRSLFNRTLEAAGLGDEWFGAMLLTGLVLGIGAVFPWRAGRHIGLFLSAIVWFTLFGVFASASVWTPVVISMPIFGAFSIGIMYADTKRKRREKLASR